MAAIHLSLFFLPFAILISILDAKAQLEKPQLGLSVRPIIPSGLFDNTTLEIERGSVNFTIDPRPGYSLGVTFRQELPQHLSLESGIHMARRSYDLIIKDRDSLVQNPFRFVTYEIPFNALVFIRLTENTFLSNALGLSLDFLPSDIFVQQTAYVQKAQRTFWVLPALNAETGWEYRTEKSGIFYAGGSYHRMLVRLADTRIAYSRAGVNEDFTTQLSGHYFALNFRYFFPLHRTAPIEWDY
jgi:hypothetical protein